MKNKMQVDFAQFEYALSILGECTDDYMFILDFDNDHYALSESALDIFALDKSHFFNATKVLKGVIYSEDYEMLIKDLEAVKEQRQPDHNLEYRWLDKMGNPIWINCRGHVVSDDNGKPQYLVGRIGELGKHRKIDNVTSLYRENILKSQYMNLSKNGYFKGYVLSIGIDNFKEINEKCGMEFGDTILSNVSSCIKKSIHSNTEVFRLDGDEFVIFCKSFNISERSKVKELYKKIRREIDRSIEKSGYQTFYTISAGAVFFDSQTDDYDSIMRSARFALHNSKINGKNTYFEYSEDFYLKYIRKIDLQECLRKSIKNGFEGFELYYQPIINVVEESVYGAEALVRWSNKTYGYISPVEFIPLLEESSLIIPLGKWIIHTAVKQCKEWKNNISGFKMNINLSFVQLLKSDIVKDALECIDSFDIPHENIVFELTESGELESSQATKNVLKSFMEKEIELAIDDFGTGYSNFRYIKDMMFGMVKIDRVFIKNIQHSDYDYRLVKHITDMAHSLNLKVCYEGIETERELEIVKSLKPDCIQGFFYGRPVNPYKFEQKHLKI
ncbi:bifunctional diguanylate cyclase/phosphodiesterase [[Clostridium] fimetarium]|uniref:Diguanylate cyclase (GGDEF) domain-containing protein n=1 Tax=[Clostridium] fimetarium TaxID=99656 RepID=A0A1I0QJV4_9FIRM|nr:GGDEF and EAL domain-containing protein [[Clostridium] fimetarium]SEW27309.1 diguanylate cyclase (GGDEF) domain-containing protein [[Clostridium] fimetarium]